MRRLLAVASFMFAIATSYCEAKTLVVYYSYTNNCKTLAQNVQAQTGADLLEVHPAEEGVKYDANNYAIGSALISAIRNNPNDASSYPAIKTNINNLTDYNTVIIVTPLWWSNMAAPMQTFLFKYGKEMTDKHVGLIVSSHSSGISGVEQDARRLIPGAQWMSASLWVRSSQTSSSSSMITTWLNDVGYNTLTSINSVTTPIGISAELNYALDGRTITTNTKGLHIQRQRRTDGTIVTKKILR